MYYKKGDIVEVFIEKLAFGGMGIGKLEDRVIFVQGTAAGDRANIVLTKIKKSFFEGRLIEVLSPSSSRIAPRCKHFEICGGCQWQFLSYEDQLKTKENLVRETLEHLGKFKDVQVLPIIGSDSAWFYRNKMEFSFASDSEGSCMIGLHPPRKYYEVFDLEECFLQSSFDAFVIKIIRDFASFHGLKVYDYRENQGLLRCLFVRSGKRTGEVMINLVTSHEPLPNTNEFVELITSKCHQFFMANNKIEGFLASPKLVSVYLSQVSVQKGRKTALSEIVLYGSATYKEELTIHVTDGQIFTLYFDVHPQAFFQPNPLQAEKLYAAVLRAAELNGSETVFDLFCGAGTISLCLSRRAKNVIGIDIHSDAVSDAQNNARKNNISNVSFMTGDVSSLFPAGVAADVIVVDPPRAGLTRAVIEKIVGARPQKIVYVSCNPTTFVRDAQLFLQNGYSIKYVQPVDMLPHTSHIETVALIAQE